MKNLKVMFDVDGVLADFVLGFTSLAAKEFGTPTETTTQHRVWDWFPGLDKRQVDHLWKVIEENDRGFWAELFPLFSSTEAKYIKLLTERTGVEVYFVSNRHTRTALQQTRMWLANWLDIHNPNVVLVGKQGKGYVAKGLEADFCIDDKLGNAVYVGYEAPKTRSYLIERPYNAVDGAMIGRTVVRVPTLTPFLADVEDEWLKRSK